MDNKTIAIILAGGTGERMNEDIPKQFMCLAGKPLIMYSLETFSNNMLVDGIIVVGIETHIDKLKEMIKANNIDKVIDVIPGGITRQESSYEGVKKCPSDTGYVLIHDAARPMLNDRIIGDVLDAAKKYGASVPVTGLADTVAVEKDGFIDVIPDRDEVRRIQTPQGFLYEVILKAHEGARDNKIRYSTDDCGLVRKIGRSVKTVEGSITNIKITDPSDIVLAEREICQRKG